MGSRADGAIGNGANEGGAMRCERSRRLASVARDVAVACRVAGVSAMEGKQ